MKQAFIKRGVAVAMEVPDPALKPGHVKIKVAFSTISAGTEMTSIQGSGRGLVGRAIEDPSQVLRALDLVREGGIRKLRTKLQASVDTLRTIGYSVSGRVLAVGVGVDGLGPGDLVAAGGSGFAVHAGQVVVPKNLVAKLPERVDLLAASTTSVGGIALHAVRRADLEVGEYSVVLGTGLLGLIALQILKASGLQVACVDIAPGRLELAASLGADLVVNATEEDPVSAVRSWTEGHGADAVVFMAATEDDRTLSQAFRMCRRKGRVVLAGVSGMNLDREDLYRDEIDLLISTSSGPGRYDESYEIDGLDYPYAYVRWTENRNFEAYLRLLRDGRVDIGALNPAVYDIERVEEAYQGVATDPRGHLLTVLRYDFEEDSSPQVAVKLPGVRTVPRAAMVVGLIGAGDFASSTILPAIKRVGVERFRLKTVVNSTGSSALDLGRKFGAEVASSEPSDLVTDPEIDLMVICTRHDSHADLVLAGLEAGRNVFVEKPLATTLDDLDRVERFYDRFGEGDTAPLLMVGFNRRHSPHAAEIKRLLSKRSSPAFLHYRMNAGFIPYDHWVHDNGGRIVGEACHLIDLMLFLVGAEVTELNVNSIAPKGGAFRAADNRSLSLSFADGSVAVIDYFSMGSEELSKEFLEVHFDGKSLLMDDYRSLKGHGVKVKTAASRAPQKGHYEEFLAAHDALREGAWPTPLHELFSTTRLSILAG